MLLAAVTSQAQIGKDVRAADLMFGIPVATGKDKAGFVQRAYRKGGRDIVATVVDGVIKRLVFSKYAGRRSPRLSLERSLGKRESAFRRTTSCPRKARPGPSTKARMRPGRFTTPKTNVLTISKDSYYKARDEKMSSPGTGEKGNGTVIERPGSHNDRGWELVPSADY